MSRKERAHTDARAEAAVGSGAAHQPGTLMASNSSAVAYLQKMQRSRWKEATDAKTVARIASIKNAVELHEQGLTPRQIAAKLTQARDRLAKSGNHAQRPAIHPRTVQRWLASAKGTANPGKASLPPLD